VEKAHQVNIMRQIYANARRTYVLLGPSADDSDTAMDFVPSVGSIEKSWLISYLWKRSGPFLTVHGGVEFGSFKN
jgi:hypothetical protein